MVKQFTKKIGGMTKKKKKLPAGSLFLTSLILSLGIISNYYLFAKI